MPDGPDSGIRENRRRSSRPRVPEATCQTRVRSEQPGRADACGNCRFMGLDASISGNGMFQCRKRSPNRHGFPFTRSTDWCGDHEPVDARRKLETI